MLAEYVYVDDEPEKIIKQIKSVRFKADYDITEVCTRFGNWSRKNLYLKQNTPSYYNSQPKKMREICSDNDAQVINQAFLSILVLSGQQSKDIYDTLILSYFGEKQVITDYIATEGYVRNEWKKHASGIHDAPCKQLSKGIRVDNIYIVKPRSVQDIARKLNTNWNAVDKLKKRGEDYLRGYFASLKVQSGFELEMVKDRII
ncbi:MULTISPECIES: hypothetical protein [unclassified Gilliamella]|uniref:hypothetical protein n=1 Tax=unclassified Gilliamella TaxID=2685620 RepID=UPI00080D9171|nr:hypothetical protein [Gilliamella apicola]OCG35718.1 hypothetical protein A9G32_06515 [Gilliamella apicola]OCG50777.1 hypothetical protein A9G26_06135 [Gilliamella apicola]OCG52451.1 hypothetical protein A9G27_09770 [Gilliamella apicola]